MLAQESKLLSSGLLVIHASLHLQHRRIVIHIITICGRPDAAGDVISGQAVNTTSLTKILYNLLLPTTRTEATILMFAFIVLYFNDLDTIACWCRHPESIYVYALKNVFLVGLAIFES